MKPYEIKKVLVPLDFSLTSLRALDHAIAIAKNTGATITLLHIIEDPAITGRLVLPTGEDNNIYEGEIRGVIHEKLAKVADKVTRKGIVNVKTLLALGSASQKIVAVSRRIKADLIVMGTHGVTGLREFTLGSTTFYVASHAECPVLSVRRKMPTDEIKHILLPFSDRPHSRDKVMYAITIARIFDATIYALGIDEFKTPEHQVKIKVIGDQIKNFVTRHGVECKVAVISASYTPSTVLEEAQKINADVIVTRGDMEKHSIMDYFAGTTAKQIINHFTIPVFSIRTGNEVSRIELWHGL